MPKYKVTLSKCEISSCELIVTAASQEEAEALALAGSNGDTLPWDDYNSEVEVLRKWTEEVKE